MKSIELLSPAGDFECLKAAVQNGADAVYLGASNFSARASARNFDVEELKNAIEYATLRNVDVHLALNTLLKEDELDQAISLVKYAYTYGISAIIVQDLGLCSILLKHFPDLPIHASTQMSIHNLEGVLALEELGFSRVVLSREVSLNEIQFIRDHTSLELETFIHGALCISYSGQCLMSSMIGARSGNRGRCAQACRLPYELITSSQETVDKGYLMSPRDLCGLSFLPDLLAIGVNSLKIEGRMKTPEYVATVTRIYRKYIDLAMTSSDYIINPDDQKELLQVFNRGGFSTGHLSSSANQELIFKEKSNNMGIYIGNVANYNEVKGHISINLNDTLSIGDTITFEKEDSKYRVSELMFQKENIPTATEGELVVIGRMKGNISPGDPIYKLESKALTTKAKESFAKEWKKNILHCHLIIKKGEKITISVTDANNITVDLTSSIIPSNAISNPITKERIITQFSKTGSTPFEFSTITIDLDNDLYVNIADLNAVRRSILAELEKKILENKKRKEISLPSYSRFITSTPPQITKSISLLLNKLDLVTNYSLLHKVDAVYLPLHFFASPEYANIIKSITNSFNTYLYLPPIIKSNYKNLILNTVEDALSKYTITGFVLSNLCNLKILEKYRSSYEFIANYTFNILNHTSIDFLKDLGINKVTLSPELTKVEWNTLCNIDSFPKEVIVYGRLPVMTSAYCFLGKSNKCFPECTAKCRDDEETFALKDRLRF